MATDCPLHWEDLALRLPYSFHTRAFATSGRPSGRGVGIRGRQPLMNLGSGLHFPQKMPRLIVLQHISLPFLQTKHMQLRSLRHPFIFFTSVGGERTQLKASFPDTREPRLFDSTRPSTHTCVPYRCAHE